VAADYPGTSLTNTATIDSSPVSDPTPGNNSGSDTDTVNKSADLSITKSDGVTSVTAGTSTTYTITLTNNGPSTVPAGVVVKDTIPANTTGSTTDGRCVIASGVLTCTTTAALTPTSSTTFNLTLAVAADYPGTSLTNTATIDSSPVSDPTPGNNSGSDTDTVNKSADLSITKSDSPDPVTAGTDLTYSLTITNHGPSTATNVTVSDPVPAQTSFVSATPSQGTCDATVSCSLGTLASGASATITIVVHVNASASGTITNTATVTSTTSDANQSNNAATATTTVLQQAKGKVTGGGQVVPTSGGTASFGYIAQRKTDGGPAIGHFNYVNHTTGLHINGPVNNLVILSPTSARFSGTWGAGCTFIVYMEDNGEPGVQSGDRLGVSYACPPTASVIEVPDTLPTRGSPIIHGNNQMHKAGANSPPVANADTASTAEKTAVTINVLTNDIPGPVEDSGQTLTVTTVGAPANGTTTLNANGTITYSPTGAFNGTDSFVYTICDNGTTDGVADPLCSTGLVNVTISSVNDPPLPGAITWSGSVDPLKVSTSTTATASFTDLDSGDVHTATWNWGDGTPSTTGTVTEPVGAGPGSVSGSHTYTTAGLYTVTLTVSDNGGLAGSSVFKSVAVYNPTSTISGNGQINSPAGSYPANSLLAGTATFSSISVKYLTGATTPSGTTSFSYTPANLTFSASTFKWLITTGGKAWYKGTGMVTINGSSQPCSFLVAALDGPNLTADKFRIKIWTASGVIYDDQMGATDDAVASTLVTTSAVSITVK
jgi:uncharacterized repeat protein (TIGR01451 family)